MFFHKLAECIQFTCNHVVKSIVKCKSRYLQSIKLKSEKLVFYGEGTKTGKIDLDVDVVIS